jgi:YegS/Rv2252/BmrU family lipid kinase
MKYIFILNSFGNRSVNELIERIGKISRILDIDYKIEINSKYESTEDILNKYKDSNNIIVAVGGDGMINRVLNGIIDTDNLLSFIPYGTGNDFYKTSQETLLPGKNPIDVVKINDKHFINIACFGVDADIANDERFVHSKIIPRPLRYDVGVLYHFLSYKPKSFEVAINDEIINGDFTTIALCNARYYGGGYKIGPSSLVDDGEIEVYLVDKLNKIDMAKTILSMKEGQHEYSPHIIKKKTSNLTISSDIPISSNIDGEILTSNTFNVDVLPSKIELYNNQDLIDMFLNEDIKKREYIKKKTKHN